MISFAKVHPGQGRRFINMPTGLSPYTFYMMHSGSKLFDSMTGVNAQCSISGVRYGVVNGQVTQFAANTPPVEDNGLRACPAFTQFIVNSESIGCGLGSARMLTPVFYEALNNVNIWKFTEDTTNNTHNMPPNYMLSIADNSVIGMCCIAKYNGRHLELRIQRKDATNAVICDINLQTGAITNLLSGANVNVIDIGNGYYRIFCAAPVLSGASNPIIYSQLYTGSSSTYLGDGISGLYMGQVTLTNFGVNGIPFIPPYVPNNTAGLISVVSETATATTGMSFDLDAALMTRLKDSLRGPNAQGHLELEFVSNFDSGWLANNTNMSIFTVSNSNAAGLFVRKDSVGQVSFRVVDSALNLAAYVLSITANTSYKIAIDYGTYTDSTQKMRLTVNGVKSSVVAFSGSFGTQDLKFFFGNTIHSGWISEFKYFDRPRW